MVELTRARRRPPIIDEAARAARRARSVGGAAGPAGGVSRTADESPESRPRRSDDGDAARRCRTRAIVRSPRGGDRPHGRARQRGSTRRSSAASSPQSAASCTTEPHAAAAEDERASEFIERIGVNEAAGKAEWGFQGPHEAVTGSRGPRSKKWTSKPKKSPRSSANRSGATPSTSTSPKSAASSRSATASRACTASTTRMAGEMLEFPHGVFGIALNLEEDSVGAVLLGEFKEIKEGDTVKRTGRIISVPVGEALLGRVVNALGQPIDGKGPIATQAVLADRAHRARRRRSAAGERAAADRPQGDRRDGADRPRPARADHRRPPDRQDRGRDRRDHQPEGTPASSASTSPSARSSRPSRRSCGRSRKPARWSYTIVVAATASDPAPLLYIAPYSACTIGEYFRDSGPPRAGRLRRPVEARAGVPRDLAAAAPPAGPRSVPGRRLLPALAPAGARREAEQRSSAAGR